jgi:hypothetical protein
MSQRLKNNPSLPWRKNTRGAASMPFSERPREGSSLHSETSTTPRGQTALADVSYDERDRRPLDRSM